MSKRSWFLAAMVLAGCTSGAPVLTETLVPASGSVRLAGRPAEGVRLLFTPTGVTSGTGAFGVTDAEGKFELVHRTQEKGIVPGEYVVTFSKFQLPGGKPIPPDTSPYMAGAKESIPAKWSDPSRKGTHNIVTVVEDGKSLDFGIPLK